MLAVGLNTTVVAVDPVFHKNELAPVAFKVTELPLQSVDELAEILTVMPGVSNTETVLVWLQLPVVPVTV